MDVDFINTFLKWVVGFVILFVVAAVLYVRVVAPFMYVVRGGKRER